MADILIRGMEMPNIGEKIEFTQNIAGHIYAKFNPSRGYMCEVIELPEHGDLIDRSKLSFVCGGTTPMEMDYVRRYVVYGMPVIVPSNKEETE